MCGAISFIGDRITEKFHCSYLSTGLFLLVFLFYYKVVDGNVSSGLIKSKQLSQITSLTGSYDVAWRKHDFAKYETAFLRHVLVTV